tara:strand:+ start:1196 stop:2035 length:840 start_codon:yes stop_codon:yes gene_type:complete
MRLQTNIRIFIISLAALFTACCVHSQHQNPFFGAHTLRKAKKSIVKIEGRTSIGITSTSTTVPHLSLEFNSTASGSIIEHYKDLTMILTAAHVCGVVYEQQLGIFKHFVGSKSKITKIDVFTKLSVSDIKGRTFNAIQLFAVKKTDTCVIVTKRIPHRSLDISPQEPDIGEKAYNIGIPHGIWAPNFIPIFDGRFLGHFYVKNGRGNKSSCYSIPGAAGQSGSPVINSFGQVTGMIHSVYRRYNHLSLSSTLEQIKHVISRGQNRLDSKYQKYYKLLGK